MFLYLGKRLYAKGSSEIDSTLECIFNIELNNVLPVRDVDTMKLMDMLSKLSTLV